MTYVCERIAGNFTMTSKRFRRTTSPQLKIIFHFFFKSEYVNTFHTKDFTEKFSHEIVLPSSTTDTSATVAMQESLSEKDIIEAVEEAIGDRLDNDEREELIELALESVYESFPTKPLPTFTVLYLRFEIDVEHWHEYVVENKEALEKILEANCFFEEMEKYEVPRVKGMEEEERRCRICSEELYGGGCRGGALTMRCLHVFHGGCVRMWLTKSHHCPLCGYDFEMSL